VARGVVCRVLPPPPSHPLRRTPLGPQKRPGSVTKAPCVLCRYLYNFIATNYPSVAGGFFWTDALYTQYGWTWTDSSYFTWGYVPRLRAHWHRVLWRAHRHRMLWRVRKQWHHPCASALWCARARP
jgi:hypothetical protein